MTEPRSFADFKSDAHLWITFAQGQYYPDYLSLAVHRYQPMLEQFGQLVLAAESSEQLFLRIIALTKAPQRIQLLRIFRKYVCPEIPVEMLKRKLRATELIARFGPAFRPIHAVRSAFHARAVPDETISALLWECQDRGQKGYDLTQQLFAALREQFPDYQITGPERAGNDILLGNIFANYPHPQRPVDFIIMRAVSDAHEQDVLAVGLARYDSDRGGAQEDDRIGGYRECADELLNFAQAHRFSFKVIFLNDGPGLLLGSMWNDYARLEERWPGKIMVLTLRMVPIRLSHAWLEYREE